MRCPHCGRCSECGQLEPEDLQYPEVGVVRPFPVVPLPAHGETVIPPREYSTITTQPEPIYNT